MATKQQNPHKLSREFLEAVFLKVSPHLSDGNQKIGKLPSEVPVEDLRLLGHPETFKKALRATCLYCCNGKPSEVNKCNIPKCPSWPMRMNTNPFDPRSKTKKALAATNDTKALETSSSQKGSENVYPK